MNRLRYFLWRVRRSWALHRLYWATGTDGDWSVIAELMRFQIRRTREEIAGNHIVKDWERCCRQMLIAETLLTRMLDEPYFDHASARYPERSKYHLEFTRSLEKQDDEMLGKMLTKYLRCWWD